MKTYVCPGCLFLKNIQPIKFNKNSQYFECENCTNKLISQVDDKEKFLYETFSKYNRSGFRCKNCQRFLPKPLVNNFIICPYFDCNYSGNIEDLKKCHHPKDLVDDIKNKSLKIENSTIEQIIISQSNLISYNSHNFTLKHKHLVYQAFLNLYKKYPTEIFNYLVEDSRSGGFQVKLFQEYVKILELSLPFSFKKGSKIITITSLLDENLKVFDGISEFENYIDHNLTIKNKTSEFYIGGRSGFYSKPYYIGKILNICDENSNNLISNIDYYTFSYIKMKNISPNTKVKVSHLRVIPHYQMGSMVYINRIKKNISDECKLKFSCTKKGK